MLWKYKFSQLKGSSDDGKSKIKFLFQNQDSKSIEAKVIHFERLLMPHVEEKKLFNKNSKVLKLQKTNYLRLTSVLILFFRSWSSQTSSPCFIVFTLFLLPKLRAWTRCSWRAKAPQLPPGFLPSPASRVIHRHLNSSTPLDRRCSLRTPSKKKNRTLHSQS